MLNAFGNGASPSAITESDIISELNRIGYYEGEEVGPDKGKLIALEVDNALRSSGRSPKAPTYMTIPPAVYDQIVTSVLTGLKRKWPSVTWNATDVRTEIDRRGYRKGTIIGPPPKAPPAPSSRQTIAPGITRRKAIAVQVDIALKNQGQVTYPPVRMPLQVGIWDRVVTAALNALRKAYPSQSWSAVDLNPELARRGYYRQTAPSKVAAMPQSRRQLLKSRIDQLLKDFSLPSKPVGKIRIPKSTWNAIIQRAMRG